MNADYFIEFFNAIPDEEWKVGPTFFNEKAGCALDHAAQLPNGIDALSDLFSRANLFVSVVNDSGAEGKFPQGTPKARIIAALEHIKSL